MRAQPMVPFIRWGTKSLRVTGKPGAGPWYAPTGELNYMVVMTLEAGQYTASLENRTEGVTIKGDPKLAPAAAVANLQRTLKAIRRASG